MSRKLSRVGRAALIGTLLGLGATQPSLAAPVKTQSTATCSVTDVLLNTSAPTPIAADLCRVYTEPNDSEALLNAAGDGFGGVTGWDGQWKDDGVSVDLGALGGLQLEISDVDLNVSSGSFRLDWTGGPSVADLAVIIKSASGFIGYLFDDFLFAPADSSTGGSFTVAITNPGNGSAQALSHLTVYTANATDYICTPGDPACGGQIPEPSTLALLGIGAVAVGAMRRRRANG